MQNVASGGVALTVTWQLPGRRSAVSRPFLAPPPRPYTCSAPGSILRCEGSLPPPRLRPASFRGSCRDSDMPASHPSSGNNQCFPSVQCFILHLLFCDRFVEHALIFPVESCVFSFFFLIHLHSEYFLSVCIS